MEDDRLSQLFADFDPELSSDNLFMSRLERNLEAVELVKMQVEDMHRKSRLAIAVAGVTGFVFGILATIFYPQLYVYVSNIASPEASAYGLLNDYGSSIIIATTCIAGILLAYTAYDITLTVTHKYTNTIRIVE